MDFSDRLGFIKINVYFRMELLGKGTCLYPDPSSRMTMLMFTETVRINFKTYMFSIVFDLGHTHTIFFTHLFFVYLGVLIDCFLVPNKIFFLENLFYISIIHLKLINIF